MEGISSSSDYSKIMEDMLLWDVSQIRKTAIVQHMTNKLDNSIAVASELGQSIMNQGYSPDSSIPEDSTISVHV